ncbi:MAG: radical SAM protein [Pseudomonadota bacterium]
MGKRLHPARNAGFKNNRFVEIHINEPKAIMKKGKGLIHAALVYPNTYKAGMSSLGFQTVYRLANQIDQVVCERVFLPDPQTFTSIKKTPKSLESGLNLDRFDIILFSISFENDFDHLVHLLEEEGIPLRSSDRNHTHPLVVAGGVACFLNPEPIAPFIDAFLLGEAELVLKPFFQAYSQKQERSIFLSLLEQTLPGAYVPALHTDRTPFKIKVQFMDTLDHITTASSILTSQTAFKDTLLIETLKGCPHGCRFCSAGFIYRPPRLYPYQNIIDAMDSAVGKTNKIGLVSSAVADHPDISRICEYGHEKGFKLSFSSLRADKLSEKLIGALSSAKVKTATIAPEAGSERMRCIINKKISERQILSAAKRLVRAGIINLRLYFMIGLPFETDDDVHAIVDLTLKIKAVFLEEAKKQKKIGTITLSINPFIPKPATPFQWSAMTPEPVLKKRVSIIQQGLKKTANVTLNIESLRKAKVHALLSRGGQRTADIIELAQKNGWTSAMKQEQAYCQDIIYSEKSVDAPLPWDFLDNTIKKEFLKKEWGRAEQEKPSHSCPMIDCLQCKTCI